MEIKIDPQAKTAIYRQIVLYIQQGIREGLFKGGDMLPSMNELAAKQRISKETVKKAYGILVDMGDIVPKQGKGFYIATAEEGSRPHILLIFDKFSVYKQIVYNAFQEKTSNVLEISTAH